MQLYECLFHNGYYTDPIGLRGCLHICCRECAKRAVDPDTYFVRCPECGWFTDTTHSNWMLPCTLSPTLPLWGESEWNRAANDLRRTRAVINGKDAGFEVYERVGVLLKINLFQLPYTPEQITNLFAFDLMQGYKEDPRLIGFLPFILRSVSRTRMRQAVCILAQAGVDGVNVSGLDLSDLNLRDAKMKGWHLDGTNLNGTDLRSADLSNAVSFETAQLRIPRVADYSRSEMILYGRFVVSRSDNLTIAVYDIVDGHEMRFSDCSSNSQATIIRWTGATYMLVYSGLMREDNGTFSTKLTGYMLGRDVETHPFTWILPPKMTLCNLSHGTAIGSLLINTGSEIVWTTLSSNLRMTVDRSVAITGDRRHLVGRVVGPEHSFWTANNPMHDASTGEQLDSPFVSARVHLIPFGDATIVYAREQYEHPATHTLMSIDVEESTGKLRIRQLATFRSEDMHAYVEQLDANTIRINRGRAFADVDVRTETVIDLTNAFVPHKCGCRSMSGVIRHLGRNLTLHEVYPHMWIECMGPEWLPPTLLDAARIDGIKMGDRLRQNGLSRAAGQEFYRTMSSEL